MQIGMEDTFPDNPKEILNKMLSDLLKEREEIKDLLTANEEQLSQVNQMIKEMNIKADRDLQIFSPRNVTDSAFERLEMEKSKKDYLENENQELTCMLNKCTKYIHSLKEISKYVAEEKQTGHIDTDTDCEFMIEDMGKQKKLMILDIQEKERQRIARDLHDTTLQSLIHLIHKLELCSKYIDVDPVQAKLEIATCNKHLKSLINDGRDKIFNLRPMSFDDLGFTEVMRRLKLNLEEKSEMEINFQVQDLHCEQSLILITIYRIIQEAANNAIKHSKGTELIVFTHCYPDYYYIRVSDNGVGFSEEERAKSRNHFGVAMLEEQAKLLSGEFKIKSELGKGTVIEVKIPMTITKGVQNEY